MSTEEKSVKFGDADLSKIPLIYYTLNDKVIIQCANQEDTKMAFQEINKLEEQKK